MITTTRATERLSRRLQRAGFPEWIGKSSGDAWGKYLVFRIGGKCFASAGWSLAEAEDWVNSRIAAMQSTVDKREGVVRG